MKTKTIPVIIMLIAGTIACVLGFVYHYGTTEFFTMVLAVLVVFYLLGCIVKIIIDKNFPIEESKDTGEAEESEEMKENINSEDGETSEE